MMKKILLLLIAIPCLLFSSISTYANTDTVGVYVAGEVIDFDVAPRVIDGRTMVPMRAIFEALGANVEWEPSTETITGTKNDVVIIMKVNDKELKVNNKKIVLDVAPVVIDGRTLVPVRAVAESLGVEVLWHGDINVVSIHKTTDDIAYTKLYNFNGELVDVERPLLDKYISIGWSENIDDIKVTLYAPDGRTQKVFKNNVEAETNVGWYTQPVYTMYATDGRTIVVLESEIEAYKNVGWYETQKDAVLSAYPRNNIRILSAYGQPNSAGGVGPTIIWRNDSGATIKYITFTVVPYNAVGDIVSCTISGETVVKLKVTGPIETFNIANIDFSYLYYKKSIPTIYKNSEGQYYITHWSGEKYFLNEKDYEYVFDQKSSWDPVWYNNSINSFKIENIDIIYMDGSTETISNPPIWNTIFRDLEN